MKRIDILILDDNFIIANMIKRRIFNAGTTYNMQSGLEIFPHYLEIDNCDYQVAATCVNNYIRNHNIKYLIVDRGFGKILDPLRDMTGNLDSQFVYKDNNQGGYNIEDLLLCLKQLKNNSLPSLKGIVVYTYDNYKELNKDGEVIKEEIRDVFKSILPPKCKLEVLLAYSDIYKIANVDLYEGYAGIGIVKLGKRNDFLLYGVFLGELLYHRATQMISLRNLEFIKEKRASYIVKLIILYLIFISISVGSNAISSLLPNNNILFGLVSLLFGILLPIVILFLKPSVLISIDE